MKKTIQAFTIILLIVSSLTNCKQGKVKQTPLNFCRDVVANRHISYPTEVQAEMAILPSNKWSQGDTLFVFFYEGDSLQNNRILAIAKEWTQYTNVYFCQSFDVSKSQVKISYRKIGYWSYNGKECLKEDTTMSLQDLDTTTDIVLLRRVVLHEFGHVFGCIHEHQSPTANIHWDTNAVYAFYALPPNKWPHEMVNEQIFKKYSSTITNYSTYDPKSIMHYPVPKELTTDNFEVDWINELSDTDKVNISKFYLNEPI